MHRSRRAQPSAQLRDRLLGLACAQVTAAAGERFDHAQLLIELLAGALLRLVLAEAGIVPAEKLHPQLDHVRRHRAILYLVVVPANDHVIDAIAMAIDATHPGANVEVQVGMPAGIAELRIAGVAIITRVGRRAPCDLEQNVVIGVELCPVILDRR